MFGYIKPYKPELRVRELEFYRSVYCGLCRSMGAHTGCASRFTLSYDFVFLAAIRMTLSDVKPCFSSCRCPSHPLRKKAMCNDNPALSYCAAAAAVLTECKVRDDINDSSGFKRFFARVLHIFAKSMRKKAGGLAPENEVEASLAKLYKLEAEHCPSIDASADCFGELLSAVMAHGLDGPAARIAAEIGKSIGRYIYVLDAADDLLDDKKSGSYNPLVIEPVKPDNLSVAVRFELTKLEAAVNLLDFTGKPELEGIIKNIIYLGMPHEADSVFAGKRVGGSKRKGKI